MEITRLNEVLKDLPGEIDTSVKGNDLTAEMRYGLAQAYSNKGFREYMELAIRTANNGYDIVDDMNGHIYVKSKKITLKALLTIAKTSFLEVQKLEKKPLQDNK